MKKEELLNELHSLEFQNERLRMRNDFYEGKIRTLEAELRARQQPPVMIRDYSCKCYPCYDDDLSGWSIVQGIWLSALTVLLIINMTS